MSDFIEAFTIGVYRIFMSVLIELGRSLKNVRVPKGSQVVSKRR
jgi:hypothetical protein